MTVTSTVVPRRARFAFRTAATVVLVFLYAPLAIVAVLSFNDSTSLAWPPRSFTTKWWTRAFHNVGARDALWNSLQVAAVVLVLGTVMQFVVLQVMTWLALVD